MSAADYVDTVAPAPDWLQQIGVEAKRKGLNKLTMRRDRRCPQGAPPESSFDERKQMIRLVLDTNVIVSAYLNADGLPRYILRLASAGAFPWLSWLSTKSCFRARATLWIGGGANLLLKRIQAVGIKVSPAAGEPLTSDTDDSIFLECPKRRKPIIWSPATPTTSLSAGSIRRS